MTKKDFELIAEAIRDGREHYSSNKAHATHAAEVANVLAYTNPRFDRVRFVLACMPKAWVGTGKSSAWGL